MYRGLLTTFSIILIWSVSLFAQEGKSKSFEYGGVATCKACHLTKKSGAQFKVWEGSAHAQAFETLKSDKAKEVGKKMGVEDPSTSDKCLKCHVTAFGVAADMKGPRYTMEEGVGCESCHGPGSAYKSKKVMEGIWAGELKGEDYGLMKPTEEVCVTCHNEESPTYKPFKYEERVKVIAHPVPDAK